MSHSPKAQAMIEYLIYFGISFVVFISLLTFVFFFEKAEVTDLQYTALTEYGAEVQSMFFIFAQMNPTFTQTVKLHEQINNQPYNFSILASNLYLTQGDLEVILPLPTINGTTTNKTFQITVTKDEVQLT